MSTVKLVILNVRSLSSIAHRLEALADNPDVIEQVKAEASGCQMSS